MEPIARTIKSSRVLLWVVASAIAVPLLGCRLGGQVRGLSSEEESVSEIGTGGSNSVAQIAIAEGNSQTGLPSTALGTPLKVLVTDSSGVPVSGATVNWSITSGGGVLGASSSVTDSSGNAQTTLSLGNHLGADVETSDGSGVNTVSATLNGTSTSVTFTAQATVCTSATEASTPFARGDGTANSPYYICTATQLNEISDNATYVNKNFKLGKSIDLTGVKVNMIGEMNNGQFTGVFNGNGFQLQKLSLNVISQNVGLFGYVGSGGKLLNLDVTTTGVTGDSVVGVLAGYVDNGTISNCTATGVTGAAKVSGNHTLGGLVGYLRGGTISQSSASVNVETAGPPGNRIGGLVGRVSHSATVERSRSSGVTVSGLATAAGLIGLVEDATLSRSWSSNAVSADIEGGGLVGSILGASSLADCYASGAVTVGTHSAGGLVGMIFSASATVSRCYSSGAVGGTAGSDVGGLVGSNTGGTVTHSFWDTQTSGQATDASAATGRTTGQMQTATTFTGSGWDDSTVWSISGGSYPTLR